jgi:hypothetical protein
VHTLRRVVRRLRRIEVFGDDALDADKWQGRAAVVYFGLGSSVVQYGGLVTYGRRRRRRCRESNIQGGFCPESDAAAKHATTRSNRAGSA